MLTPQFLLPIHRELVVDLFAGGGGASCGIEQAIGRPVDLAVNHDPEAVSLHQANHPQTRHYVSNVFEVDPVVACGGQPVGLLWASPDCTFHSKARGGKPHRDRNKARRRRGLAGVVVKWAAQVRPRVIALENVEEFQHWGPLLEDGQPCPARRGQSFMRWVARLRNLGYAVEWRQLRGCDYGAPTIRRRLFLIARCDGAPIIWPAITHGAPDSLPVRQRKLLPWPVAADCIDWGIPCPSIFERDRPLAEATLRRIAKGVMRYVVEAAEPFVVRIGHTGHGDGGKVRGIHEPLSTITSKAEHVLVAPTVVGLAHGEHKERAGSRSHGPQEPLRTIHAGGGNYALVAAFLAQYNNHGGTDPHSGRPLTEPVSTLTTTGSQQALVASSIVKLRGTSQDGQRATEPSAGGTHHAEVRAFLAAWYGTEKDGAALVDPMQTIPTRDRFGLVTVHGEPYAIVDIGLRMLSPRELFRAQGFPASYIIDRGADGRALTKTAQVRLCGNSVCPPLARAIVAANFREVAHVSEIAA